MEFYTSVIQRGNYILYRGIQDGEEVMDRIWYQPSLFVTCPENIATHKGFYGQPVQKKVFDSIAEMNKYIRAYGDIPDHLYGNKSSVAQFIYEKFGSKIEYNPKQIHGIFLDIEVLTRQKVDDQWIDGGFPIASEAKFPVNAICQYDTRDGKYHIWSMAEWSPEESCFPELIDQVVYNWYSTEEELLRNWMLEFSRNYPHYITGWNVEKFDIPYLVNRIEHVLGSSWCKTLSPWKQIDSRDVQTKYGLEQTWELHGISILDYLDLYKKHTFTNRESYTLDFISEVELGEHKKVFTGTHGSFFWDDPQGFQDYNLKDVSLVVNLDRKLQLINLVESLAYFAGINYEETFSPIRTWDSLIYRECMNRGVAIPFHDRLSIREEYEGAFVFEPKIGMHHAVVSFDVTSLYPSVNRSWNIGADALVQEPVRSQIIKEIAERALREDDKDFAKLAFDNTPFVDYYQKNELPGYVTEILHKHNVGLTVNWQFFRNDKEAVTTYLQTKLFLERKSDKKKAQEYHQREKELHQEMVRRGLV